MEQELITQGEKAEIVINHATNQTILFLESCGPEQEQALRLEGWKRSRYTGAWQQANSQHAVLSAKRITGLK